jgi:hypothetical protein
MHTFRLKLAVFGTDLGGLAHFRRPFEVCALHHGVKRLRKATIVAKKSDDRVLESVESPHYRLRSTES